MKRLCLLILAAVTLASCSTDFPKKSIDTTSLNGFIEGGNAGGVYGEAGLKITKDSIQMTDWPMSRLTDNLNTILDREFEDVSEFPGFYTIQIANVGELEQIEFCDSIASILVENKLLKE